ncbi:MAG: hypothetical protein JWP88_312, partial [Flaviaesturariibacter sp.]|nr:hypothetical protein [Flaviaesturariibacter sp.]
QIDMATTAPGMYLLQTNDGNGNTETIKIVKQ